MLHPLFFALWHRVAETCLMHILLCSYHFAVHLQICVLHVPYNATGLYPVFYQSRHMLHIHLFVNNLCNLLVYDPVLRVLVLFCNQTILIFVCCYDISNSIPDGLCLFCFHPVLLSVFHQHANSGWPVYAAYEVRKEQLSWQAQPLPNYIWWTVQWLPLLFQSAAIAGEAAGDQRIYLQLSVPASLRQPCISPSGGQAWML